jgi:hypothetical protein
MLGWVRLRGHADATFPSRGSARPPPPSLGVGSPLQLGLLSPGEQQADGDPWVVGMRRPRGEPVQLDKDPGGGLLGLGDLLDYPPGCRPFSSLGLQPQGEVD